MSAARARVFEKVEVATPDPQVERVKLGGVLRAMAEQCATNLQSARTCLDIAGRDAFSGFEKSIAEAEAHIAIARKYHREWLQTNEQLKKRGAA